IELPGLAIRVDEGAREEGLQQRRAAFGSGRENFIDKGVLGAAKGDRMEPRLCKKFRSVIGSAMGRGEDSGKCLPGGSPQLVDFVALGHSAAGGPFFQLKPL